MSPRNNPHQRNQLYVPQRRGSGSTVPKLTSKQPAPESHYSKSDLAKARAQHGFDDIPVEEEDLDNVRLRDIIRAWFMQAIGRKETDGKRNSRIRAIKNDIKWALQADLDEPVKPYVKPPTATQAGPSPKVIDSAKQHTPTGPDPRASIDININFGALPSLSTIKGYLQKGINFALQRKRMTVGIVVVVIVGGTGINALSGFIGESGLKKEDISSTKPEFDTLLPNGKSIDGLGGWKRVSPPGAAPAFAYSDEIDNVKVAVSQQALPDDFKKDTPAKMTELAKGFHASDKLTTANGTVIYLGSSAKGPQSAILAINQLLILIKSTGKIDDKKWASYVDSLITPIQKF